jgi:hypothetical protein
LQNQIFSVNTDFAMKEAKKAANADLKALVEFLNSDGDPLSRRWNTNNPIDRRVAAILAADSREHKTNLVSLRENLREELSELFKPQQPASKTRRTPNGELAFSDSSLEGKIENLLNRAAQYRPKLVHFRVTQAKEASRPKGGPLSAITFNGREFLVESVIHVSSARVVFYQIIDSAIRGGMASTLKLCPKCKKGFAFRKEARCSACARAKRNKYMKGLMRERRESGSQIPPSESETERLFEAMLRKAASKTPDDQQQAAAIARKVIQADPWKTKTFDKWIDAKRSGKTSRMIMSSLDGASRIRLEEQLREHKHVLSRRMP